MRVSVIGADGQLGSDICEVLSAKGWKTDSNTIENIDISSPESVAENRDRIDGSSFLINCAAFHNPPLCEKFPDKAFRVNATGVLNLAKLCMELNIPLVHFSTDYVFDGKKRDPYIEADQPNPLNVYGISKLAGENIIRAVMNEFYILRVSGIYGKNPCIEKGYNFVDKMLELSEKQDKVRVVDDEILTPTSTEDIAFQLFEMLSAGTDFGIYHATNEGSCSWHEFAKEIFRLKKKEIKVDIAHSEEFAGEVNRPKYSVLENGMLKRHGINIMPNWKESLMNFIKKYRS